MATSPTQKISSSSSSIPTTMRAWQFSSTSGGMEKNMHLNTSAKVPAHDAKALGHDKFLIRVIAAAINPVDYKMAELPLVGRLLYGKDSVPGSDFAGIIAAAPAGAAEGELKEGQLVLGKLTQPVKRGTLAEYTIAKRSAVAVAPAGLDPVQAAGVGVAGLTAYQCIVPFVEAGKGNRVFINGGSGGTGTWGIQIAKELGCHVVTSCSGNNAALCKSLGADEVVDYRKTNVVKALTEHVSDGRKFDLVVDNVGASPELYWQCHHFLSETGHYVQVGAPVGLGAAWNLVTKSLWPGFLGGGKRHFQFLGVRDNSQHFGEIAKWMQQGRIKPVLQDGESLAMEDGAKAFATLRTGRTTGKLVIRVSKD